MTTSRVENIYKLSPLQQGMLFHALYEPESDAYIVQFSATLRGGLDPSIVREAWQQVVSRHEMLRTSFHWKEVEKPVQVVRSTVDLPWQEEDWRDLTPGDQQRRLYEYREQEIRRGFVLDRAPLMRLALIRTADDSYRFIWTLHHLILDGWSLHIVLREVFTLVRALGEKRDAPLPPPRPFGDYLSWLKKQNATDARSFWREMIGDVEQPTPVPSAAAHSDGGGGRAEVHLDLDSGLTEAIERFSRTVQVTTNTVAGGAWSLALSLLSGERDVVFGSVVSGRTPEISGVESMVGLFINTLPVRVNVCAETDVTMWLKSLQRTLVQMRNYEYSSLADVQKLSSVPSGRSLFDSIVVFENYPVDEATFRSLSGIEVSDVEVSERTTYPLTLTVLPGRSMRLRLAYDTAHCDKALAQRLLGHIEHLLRQITSYPTSSLGELTLLDEVERQRVLFDWNATERHYEGPRTIHHLFEQQAARTPGAVAIRHGEQALTFAELNERANRMAHYLIRNGVGTESLVGVALDRSPGMVVALLGILKAGGAWVPLDPGYPRDRVAFMCEDAGVEIVLTTRRHQGSVPDGPRKIEIDTEWDDIATELATDPQSNSTGDNLAYVVYTSGSTGRPKGVLGLHGGAVNRFRWMWERYPFAPGEVHAQKTSLNFLDSLWEIFGSLLQGVPISIFDDALLKDPRRFISELDQQDVSRLVLVPSLLRLMLDSDVPSPLLRKLRICVTSGEALPVELWRRFRERMPHALLINLYGSSEVSADATFEELHDVPGGAAEVPIGRPIANTQAYILDRDLRPVPVGVMGELFIGGEGVARGYLNRPDLTAQRFLDDPFLDGGRLFRTGDLARWRSDGRIDYLGRSDHQIKIRGFRVELGEIEATITQQQGVRHAVVVAHEHPQAGKRLVAYVVADGELAASEIRTHVASKLPEYMVPTTVVFLETLPLTPSGKLDRTALPEPDRIVAGGYIPPRTPTEQQIADIFANVLGVESVGAEADFFDLGGHSLLATQVVSRIRQLLGADLAVAKVFEARTVSELAQLVDEGQSEAAVTAAPGEKDHSPLSFAQQRLWFLDQVEPGNPLYNVPTAVRIRGRVDYDALQRTLTGIVARHEALRTRLLEVDGDPVAVVAEPEDVHVSLIDVPSEERALELAREEALRSFDLATDTLLRARLFRLADDDHLLAVTMHHIASDGWSIGVLLHEFATLYDAFSRGEPSPLTPLPMQYGEFARWQRERVSDERIAEQLAWWKHQLDDAVASIDLPTDRPRPPVQSHRGAAETFLFPRELLDGIVALSKAERSTVFMTLLAAFQLLLHRYSGQSDISVGTPVAGRTHVDSESLIGFFINTLVLRTQFDGEPSFRELLSRVRETALGAYGHQDLPFEKLVGELQPDRSPGQQPLFQVMFVLQNEPMKVRQPAELEMRPVHLDVGVSKFDLTLQFTETASGLDGVLEYSTDLFDRPTVVRLIRHLETLLQAIVRDPERKADELPLLDSDERHRLLVEWNDTARAYSEPFLLHRLVEEQVARTPDSPAVTFAGTALTYRELNRRANQLARRLRSRSVGPGVLVGVAMERSIEMVVSLLAILKAGGAYVPIDPDYPAERIRFMLDDADAKVIVTQSQFASLVASPDASLICLDTYAPELAGEQEDDLDGGAGPDDLAYVIYTSGSTGMPKGAMNSHRGIVNRLRWMQDELDIRATDVVAQKTPFSFDVSVWEFFWPLMSGARLAVAPPGIHRDSALLDEWIRREDVSVIHFVPPMLQIFLQHSMQLSDTLRLVICSGEALSVALQNEFFARSRAELHNLYGPTEAAIDVTHWKCIPGEARATVPIGRPIANTQIHILDGRGEPVPIGVPGELHIGGVQTGRGYLNRPELTGEKFVDDHLASSGGRLYRTGDLARWLADGSIEFLGRLDHQIKLRGFRIELGEIESLLAQHDGIAGAVVVTRGTGSDAQLVAYAVPDAGGAPSVAELREALRKRLPEYMIPSAFVFLDALPLSPNGKVDRRRLPAPSELEHERAAERVAPRTETERTVAEIWSELLKVDSVSVHDDFFALGGHSLLATRLVARVRDTSRVELPLQAIFAEPTLEAIARRIDESAMSPQTRIEPVDRTRDLPLSFIQERLWFLDQFDPGTPSLNIPLVVRVRGALDEDRLQRAVNGLVGRHEALRTNFISVDGAPRAIVTSSRAVEVRRVDLRQVNERESSVRREIEREACFSFDLSSGSLLRVTLLRVGDDEHALLVTVHHSVADGWSLVTMLTELNQLYEGAALPAPRIHYADFAAWQRERVSGELLDRQLDYWRRTLAGAPPEVDLPVDYPRPAVQSYRGSRLSEVFDRSLSGEVERVARRFGATTFMTLLAAFEVVVSRWSGQEEVVIGAPVANRPTRELESVVGPFLNTVALRTSLASNPTFGELLGRVRRTAVEAFQNADTPFEKVLEAIQPARDLSRTPVFQLFFNMLNFPLAKARLGGAQLAIDSVSDPLSKFDITVYVAEHEGTIRLDLVYNADLFSAERMHELLRQFRLVLESCTAQPHLRIGDVSLVSEPARGVLPDPSLPLDDTWRGAVHELFAAHARSQPERPAVIERDGTWTYGELDAISNCLANHLIQTPGFTGRSRPVVAIYAQRSTAVVASILATLKSGAAVAMLDPSYPPLRNAQCIRAISPAACLHMEDAGALPHEVQTELQNTGAATIAVPRLSRDSAPPWSTSPEPPRAETGPDDIACITFTSGSTGTPKAVAGMHRSLTHFTPWQCEEFGLNAGDRFTMLSGVAHDPLQRDIFTPLQIGAAICIPDPEQFGAPGYLLDWAAREKVTVSHLTPAMIQMLADSAGTVPSLRLAFVVGDVLSREDVRRLTGIAPSVRCINFYGSTETQRAVAWYPVTSEDLTPSVRSRSSLPLGRGIPDVQILLLTPAGNICGIGEVGEVHVRSPHLAAGYLGDEQLTRERFLPNGFTSDAHDRLYRTGDLARYLPGGDAEWVARADRQVKVRGFRIELGEIEAALEQHESVQDAVVVPFGDDSVSRRLIAYVVPRGESIEIEELRALVSERLPDVMAPAGYVFIERVPLTPNGKIDRAALPAPQVTQQADAHVQARDVVEIELTRIWEDVLDRHPIGIRDDFFALGGHSLLAVRLLSRIEQHFARKLPLVTLFERPTIEKIAAQLREAAMRAPRSPLVSIQARGQARPFFCVHPVGGTVLCYRTLSAKLGDDQPFFGLEAVGVDGNQAPLRSIEQMAGQYLRAVRERQPRGPYRIGGWSFGGIVAFEMAHQLRREGEEVVTFLLDTWTPGSLGDFEDAGDDATILRLLARALGDLAGREFNLATETLRSLGGRDEQLAYVVEEAHRLKAMPPDVGVAQLRPLFGVVEANLEARRKYRPQPHGGPLVLFKATEALIDAPENETLGWDRFAAGGLDVHVVPGNHHTMLADPSVDVLVEHLMRYFNEAAVAS